MKWLFSDPKMCDLERLFHIIFCFFALVCLVADSATFKNNCMKTTRPTHTVNGANLQQGFVWHYKVYADIHGVSLERRHQMTVG